MLRYHPNSESKREKKNIYHIANAKCFYHGFPYVCEKGPAIFTSVFLLGGGRNSSLVCLFSTLLSSPLPHLPPAAARWGLIRGKVKWAAHLCESPMPLPLSGAYLGPFVWARHPRSSLYLPLPNFPVSCHSFSCALSSAKGTSSTYPPRLPLPPISLLLSIPLSPAVTHSCSTGRRGGREPEPGRKGERERERKNMRERKERRGGGGSSLWECLVPAALWGETQQDYSLRPQLKPDLWKL